MILINDLLYIAQCEAYHVNDNGTIDDTRRDPYFARRYNSNLDGKTPENISQYATGTTAKYTKYGRDIDNLTALYNLPFYGYRVNGGDYCTTFTVWCFYQAALKHQRESGGVVSEGQAIAEAMVYCGLTKNDGQWFYKGLGTMPWVNDCILQYHEQQWLSHDDIVNGRDPQPGDIIFMGMGNDEPAHVGIVESINRGEGTIQTIEGNIGQYPMGVNPSASQKYKANICKVGNPSYRAVRSWDVGPSVDGYVVGVFHPNWGEDTVTPYPPSGIKLNHKTKILTWSVQKASIKNTIIVIKPDGTSYGMKTDAYENQAGQRSFNFNTDQPHEGYTMEPGDVIKITSRIGTGEYSEPATTMVLKYTTPEGLIYDWTTSRLSWYGRSTETKWTVVKNGTPLATPAYNNYYEDQDVVPNETTFSVFIGGDDFAFESDRAATYLVGPRPEYPTLNDSLNKFKIILYEDDEEEFNSLGICDLTDAKSCIVYEERNGEYYLELSYPMNEKSKQLKQRRIIYCKPNPFDDPEPFRIYSIKQNTKREAIVKAYHISYDLCGWILLPSYQTLSYEGFLDKLNNTIPGECVLEDLSGGRSSKYRFRVISGYPTDSQALEKIHQTNIQNNGVDNIRSLLCGDDGLIKIYGGELMFKRWNIYHMERRGGLSTYTIRYGKNMKSLEATRAVDQSYEAVFPYYLWQDTNAEGGSSAPKMVKIRSGTPVVPVREGVSVNAVDYSRILLYDVTGANIDGQNEMLPDGPSDEALVRLAREYINENNLQAKLSDGTCDFSIEIDNSLLNGKIQQNYPGIETARLCDDVSVYYPDADVTVIKKITKTEYDAIRNVYNRLEVTDGTEESNKIGSILSNNFSSSGSSTVTYEDVSKMIEKSKGGIVYFGYYNSANRMFYSDSSLVKQLPQSATSLYVDSFSGTLYTYSAGETGYRPVVDSGNSGLSENNFNANDFTWDSGSLTLSIKDSRWALRSWVLLQDYCATGDVETIVTEALTNYYTKGTIDTKFGGYYTIAQTDSAISTATTAIQTWANNRFAQSSAIPTLDDFVTDTWNALSTKAPSGVAINAHLNTLLGNYYTIGQTDSAISTAVSGMQTWVNNRAVRYDTNAQGLNDIQKGYARTNIGALSADALNDYYNKDDVDEMFSGVIYDSDRDYLDGTYSGSNWTSIKIHGVTKNIPSGGSGGEPLFQSFISNGGDVNGSVSLGVPNDSKGFMPYIDGGTTWGSLGLTNRRWWNGYIRNLYVGTSSSSDVDSRLRALEGGTCLIAGTKIKMADGAEKNIEDVKTGDLIQSFDITTNQPVEAMALVSQYTGSAVEYDALVFDDGSSAEFYGKHSIYCNEIKRLKEVDKWEVGLHSLDQNGNPIELSIKTKTKHHTKPNHYILISSNNLYYANGILMGHLTSTKYQTVKNMGLPTSVIDKYVARLDKSDAEDQMPLKPEFLTKAKAIMSEKHLLTQECDKDQVLLDKSDYSVVKTCERFLASFRNINILNLAKSLGDLKEMIGDMGEDRREEIRGRLGVKKDRLAEVTRQYNAFRREYRGSLPKHTFADSVTEGNEDLETLKEWAKHLKENKNDHQ